MNQYIVEMVRKIKKHRSFYEQSEMAVRSQIVNPILRSLGWDTENPEEVQPNVSTEEGIPDYSLLKGGKKVLFIEAKKLSIDIEKKEVIRQLANYCFGEGMEYGVLTNGSIWVLFRAFQKNTTMSERVVWKTDIENDDIAATVRRLNTISKENIGDIETLIKKLPILDDIWQSLRDEPKDLVKGFIPVFENLIRERHPGYKFPISEIEDFVKERVKELISPTAEDTDTESSPLDTTTGGGTHPREMKIGTDTYQVKNWYEILVNTAEWLVRKGKLKREDCPIPSGHRWNLVNTQPKHRDGRKDFISPRKLSNGLYIETSYSAANCIIKAQGLLEKYRYKSDILSVT
jgi:hypothetical protein